jgi:eukaryotic-like serine/threonine-protein kinase
LKALTLIRFEGFELDPAARSLKREGRLIALTPKTFDLLFYLAGHPHQVLTKDQILAAVWPDSFVEESNLSQHVFLLRKALSASGRADRVVVTVPGKGYQFTAAVEQTPLARLGAADSQPAGALLMHSVRSVTSMVVEEETDDELPVAASVPAHRAKRRLWLWASGGVALLLLAIGSFLLWLRPAPAGHVDLVLSELENRTGDPDFDQVLSRALQIDLEQSPYLNLLPHSRIQQTLTEMQHSKEEKLTPALAREICERNNAQVVLHGAIARLGNKYLVILDADSCVTGKPVAGYKADASSKEAVLTALDHVAGHVRHQLGESRASLDRFEIPIQTATTPSLDALRAYSEGSESFDRGDMKASQVLLQRAIQLDPNFASAYKSLSSTYYNLGDTGQASTIIKKAFDLRDRTSERERLNIEIAYYYFGTYDWEAAARSLKLYLDIYPNSPANWGNLCNLYTQLGQYSPAIDAGERGLHLDPRSGFVAEVLARAYKRANRFTEAKAVSEKSIADGRDRWGTHSILYQIAYAERDSARIKTETDWGLSHTQKHMTLDNLAEAAATGGRLREAEDAFAQGRAESLHDGDADFADAMLIDLADIYVKFEEPDKAANTIKHSQAAADAPGGPMSVRAELGDLAPAQHYLASGHPELDSNTIHTYRDVPMLRAMLAIKSHKPSEAVHLLEPARPYQLCDFAVPYMRARAETEAGMLDAAAADYRLILDNQGVDPVSPLYSLSHLRLARVLFQQKQIEPARAEYKAFFEAWKNADMDLPMLVKAKQEYAKLPAEHP